MDRIPSRPTEQALVMQLSNSFLYHELTWALFWYIGLDRCVSHTISSHSVGRLPNSYVSPPFWAWGHTISSCPQWSTSISSGLISKEEFKGYCCLFCQSFLKTLREFVHVNDADALPTIFTDITTEKQARVRLCLDNGCYWIVIIPLLCNTKTQFSRVFLKKKKITWKPVNLRVMQA